MANVEYSDYVNIRGVEVREKRVSYDEQDGSEHIAIFVEDKNGRVLFAPEFLSHTNDYVKVEVTVHLPGHAPEFYEIVDYDLNAHAMAGLPIPHRAFVTEKKKDDDAE